MVYLPLPWPNNNPNLLLFDCFLGRGGVGTSAETDIDSIFQ